MINTFILGAVCLTGALLIWPRLANARLWRASITPLASIIGSGFLVLGPILDANYGGFAPLVMAVLCLVAYLFGAAIRYNISQLDEAASVPPINRRLETLASAMLAFAYVVSVSYYLNLFGAFGVRLTSFDDAYHANLLTTAVFTLILIVGWTRGFSALERMEQVTVGLKLAIIAGLIAGLAVYFGHAAQSSSLMFTPARATGWAGFTLLAGLIVTVQGFETSRYLGSAYDASTRRKSMKLAQWVSSGIYIIYIIFVAYAFETDPSSLNETAIIDMMQVVAPILPGLLIAAALSAQFSAAVSDTSGSGGLVAELSKGRISEKVSYLGLVLIGIMLTWSANVFEIISYASRAFAAYYTVQALIAANSARAQGRWGLAIAFVSLAGLGAAITLFGTPVE